MHFCTVCDKNYLLKGIVMYNSLVETMGNNFRLHWLCIDRDTYDAVRTLSPLVSAYFLTDLETTSSELRQAKNNPVSGEYGDKYSQYCWTLAPWFTDYKLHSLPANAYLAYVDADICFYNTPAEIIPLMGEKAIGIHTHRFGGSYKPQPNGWFNVGVVVFKNNLSGRTAASRWKNWLINTDHPYYTSHGTCGDQKYLELFYEQIPNEVCVFDNDTHITHMAPWCTNQEPGKKLQMYHFSHFVFDEKSGDWKDSWRGEWNPAQLDHIRPLYEDYSRRLLSAKKQQLPKISLVGNLRIDEAKEDRLTWLKCTLRSFEFLKDHCQLILNFEGCSPELKAFLTKELMECPIENEIFFIDGNTYGDTYSYLLTKARYPFVLNFMEDHFCVIDEPLIFLQLLQEMEEFKVDLLKTTFFEIERNSIPAGYKYGRWLSAWRHTPEAYRQYQSYYGYRFYIGVNFITTMEFAEKFWQRSFDSQRPHDWEIFGYDSSFEHVAAVPMYRILVAIDDDHGEPGTCLLSNVGNYSKFEKILDEITQGKMKIV